MFATKPRADLRASGFFCSAVADGHYTLADANNQTNSSLANLANNRCFSFHPDFHGNVIAQEDIFKTLIYSYAWAHHVWRNSEAADTGNFRPENTYGIQIISERVSQQSVNSAYIAWLIAEIGNSMEANNHFTEITATVYLFDQLYSTVRVFLQAPGVKANVTRNSPAAEAENRTDDSRSDRGGHVDDPTIAKRGSSPYSFDHKLVTKFSYAGGGLVVKGVEPILNGKATPLSGSAQRRVTFA